MLVKEIMRAPVVTIEVNATLRQAAARMLEYGVNGLPVVDEDERVVGIIGLKDILRAPTPSIARAQISRARSESKIAQELDATLVRRVMATKVFTVREEQPLLDAIAIMVNQGVHPVPVLRDGRLVGVISRADAVRALLQTIDAGVPV